MGPADISNCPPVAEVPCNIYAFGYGSSFTPLNHTCRGEHLLAISRREREQGHPKACCYDAHARAEHASVAAFAKLSLDLLAHQAPAELVRRVHHAAVDEIEHARTSFELAARFAAEDGMPSLLGPGPLAVPAFATAPLAELTRETFRDGCIGELAAALRLRRSAATAADDVERDALLRIADDEERHAELAWAIVAWAAGRDANVLAELGADLSTAPEELRRTVIEPCLQALGA